MTPFGCSGVGFALSLMYMSMYEVSIMSLCEDYSSSAQDVACIDPRAKWGSRLLLSCALCALQWIPTIIDVCFTTKFVHTCIQSYVPCNVYSRTTALSLYSVGYLVR